ncbi:MAG TPA: YbhB/YbcL family Raf kinase inhibitor-like protein [Candidatus Eremiobacteraceae bacterium]|nr:YbhB/YbcL family Raf kinase inhibitor-like protein [Candidatus Eremiobacteraceae bacterium]
MKQRIGILFASIALVAGCALFTQPGSASPTFVLASTTFADGATIPTANAFNGDHCGGKNISPELHWTAPPAGTASFALTIYDPDAHGGWWHWVVSDINAQTRALPAGVSYPGVQARTSFGTAQYGGPCPPVGDSPHHYEFTLYALNARLGSVADGPSLLRAIPGHVLATAHLLGRYSR